MMENKDMPNDVPYIVFEGTMARAERTIKRLIIIVVLEVLLIVATNGSWLWYINQYDFMAYDYSCEYSQDGKGINIIGNDNGVDRYWSATGGQKTATSSEEKGQS